MISITHVRRISAAVAFLGAFVFAVSATPAHAATNLITNGDLDTSTVVVGQPDHFAPGGFDDTATFGYSATGGPNGTDAYVVATTSIHTDGDEKWVHDAVTVTPGSLYTFSDSYRADVDSYVVAAYVFGNNPTNVQYKQLAILSSTGSAWKSVTADFSVPATTTSVTVQIFHLLKSNGTLATAHYSLTPFSNSTNDLFTTPLISVTFDDGWATQYENAFASLKNNVLKGTFFIISNPMIAASYDLIAAEAPDVVKTGNSWSPIYTDPGEKDYRFGVTYTSTDSVTVVATYPLSTTTTATGTTTIGNLPAGTSVRGSLPFVLPAQTTGPEIVTPVTISMVPTSGTLTSSNAVLNEYPEEGYMSADQLKDLNAAGNEIAAHTVSHCSLLTLTNCSVALPPGATVGTEISSSTAQIFSVTGLNATTLAYPYGDYDASVEAIAADPLGANLSGARSVDFGYNRVSTDKFALKSQSVDAATSVTEVENWIDTAIANHFWLILTFHQIDTPANIVKNGEDTGTTPDNLNAILAYIKGKGATVDVKTVAEGLAIMNGTVNDNIAPVITLTGDASTSVMVDTTYTDAGATAVDQPGNASVPVTTTYTFGGNATSSVNTNVVGTYVVHYNAQDTATVPNHAVEVTRTVNVNDTLVVPVVVIEVTTASLPSGTVNSSYSQTVTASTSLSGPLTWVLSGSLPAGLSLDNSSTTNLIISGTPTAAGTSNFTLAAGNGTATSTAKSLSITVADATPVVPPPSNGGGSSGGNGGGGGVVGSGSLSIGYVNINPTAISLPGAVLGASTNCFVFTQPLAVGSTGSEVTQLQTRLTLEGLFSAGATGYFGSITRASVMAYQAKNGLDMVGNVGPKTRAALNASCTTPSAPAAPATSPASFTLNLSVGSTGSEVTLLQKVLIDLGFLKIDAPTGYFGTATRAAVMGYQTSRGIQAVGSVGPQTRAALNSNQAVIVSEK